MGFIRHKNTRLRERGVTLRRELVGFMALVTLWGLLLNLTASALFDVLRVNFGDWVARHQPVPLIGGIILFLLLCYSGAVLLTAGMTGSMDEVRKLQLILPVAADAGRVRIAAIQNYWVTRDLKRRMEQLDQARLRADYEKARGRNRGRPMSGEFFDSISEAIAAEMVHSLGESCDFLLSKSAQFHGVDFTALARPRGPCPPMEVEGQPGAQVRLPYSDRMAVKAVPPDKYGKSAKRIVMRGRYAAITFELRPQWALLSEAYHAPHLKFARARLEPGMQALPLNAMNEEPAIWFWEVPILVRVRFRNWLRPFVFLSSRFELYADWVGELLERFDIHWSWEGFVEHAPEPGKETEPA